MDNYVYFLFSQRVYNYEKDIAEKRNVIFKPNKVLHDGKWKEFTHKTKTPSKIQELISDAIIIAKVKETDIKII